ncbi:DUF3035 domain-containing protein [Caenispirillum bisanense]|uniref:Beta-barrel assembly machine subunit BamF n=1 Tax=Caenispirillum bisanense TaxID=414052 RepID=A0A286GKS9_9PROT|nr:DUF3035 domain-containing protein [Caenispirillum bisanense]SOD96110.1 Beta-barrel assembly machine subunit BamF [Caenispirillum bisanense]
MRSSSLRSVWLVGGALAVTLALSACGNTKQVLGLEREGPDEFTVVSRAPLSIPPQFSLRPPEPGAPRPQEGTAEMQARRALTGQQVQQAYLNAGLSPGESVLLSKTGAAQAPDDIRQVVNRESSVLAEEERTLTDRLVFWRGPTPPGTIVDPEAEARRIRENQALGTPVTQGETPKIERREKAFLEGLF